MQMWEAYDKSQRHGLDAGTVEKVTQRTNRQHQSQSSYKYETYARRFVCGIWNCTEVERQLVRVAVDFRTSTPDGKQFGVVTAYCPGAGDKCPAWVNAAL